MSVILIVEDDPLVSSFVAKGLKAHGHTPIVVDNGDEAIDLCVTDTPDLIILDMSLVGRQGYEVLEELRGQGQTVAVIVVTGRPDLRDAVASFAEGADDYMSKPFRFDELLARVNARLRSHDAPYTDTLVVGDVTLDLRTRRATVSDLTVELTGREFALLETFMRHADQVLSRSQLLSQVWGYGFDPRTNVVNVYVASLRAKLGHEVIEAKRGVGYRFTGRAPRPRAHVAHHPVHSSTSTPRRERR
jgi:DNA-binding response OmpR family regulator